MDTTSIVDQARMNLMLSEPASALDGLNTFESNRPKPPVPITDLRFATNIAANPQFAASVASDLMAAQRVYTHASFPTAGADISGIGYNIRQFGLVPTIGNVWDEMRTRGLGAGWDQGGLDRLFSAYGRNLAETRKPFDPDELARLIEKPYEGRHVFGAGAPFLVGRMAKGLASAVPTMLERGAELGAAGAGIGAVAGGTVLPLGGEIPGALALGGQGIRAGLVVGMGEDAAKETYGMVFAQLVSQGVDYDIAERNAKAAASVSFLANLVFGAKLPATSRLGSYVSRFGAEKAVAQTAATGVAKEAAGLTATNLALSAGAIGLAGGADAASQAVFGTLPVDGGSTIAALKKNAGMIAEATAAGALLGIGIESGMQLPGAAMRALKRDTLPLFREADREAAAADRAMYNSRLAHMPELDVLNSRSPGVGESVLRRSMPEPLQRGEVDSRNLAQLQAEGVTDEMLYQIGVGPEDISKTRFGGTLSIDIPLAFSRLSQKHRAALMRAMKADADSLSINDIATRAAERKAAEPERAAAIEKWKADHLDWRNSIQKQLVDTGVIKPEEAVAATDIIEQWLAITGTTSETGAKLAKGLMDSLGFKLEDTTKPKEAPNAKQDGTGTVEGGAQEAPQGGAQGQVRLRGDAQGGMEAGAGETLKQTVTPETWARVADSEIVDGLLTRKEVPNTDSIAASLGTDYTSLGVRRVKMSDLGPEPSPEARLRMQRDERVSALAEKIKQSGEINPLIVVIGSDGVPYILEGAHRIDALDLLGKKEIPALVVQETGLAQANRQKAEKTFAKLGEISTQAENNIVTLFKNKDSQANVSTVIHEFTHAAHKTYNLFADLVEERPAEQRSRAEQDMLDDLNRLNKWAGLKRGEVPRKSDPGYQAYVKGMEKVARGFEKYMAEGRAPTRELQGVFDRIGEWIRHIYRRSETLKADLPPEIRDVFDRWIATREAVEDGIADTGATDAVKAFQKWAAQGVDDPNKVRLSSLLSKALEGVEALGRQAVAKRIAELVDVFSDSIRKTVENEVRALPRFRALLELNRLDPKREPLGFSRNGLTPESADRLRKAGFLDEKNGVDIADMAERYGVDRNKLIEDILTGTDLKTAIDNAFTAARDAFIENMDKSRIVTRGSYASDVLSALHKALKDSGVYTREDRIGVMVQATERFRAMPFGEAMSYRKARQRTANAMQKLLKEIAGGDAKKISAALDEARIAGEIEKMAMDLEEHYDALQRLHARAVAADPKDGNFAFFESQALRTLTEAYGFGRPVKRDIAPDSPDIVALEMENSLANEMKGIVNEDPELSGRLNENADEVIGFLRDPDLRKSYKDMTVDEFQYLANAVEYFAGAGRDNAPNKVPNAVETMFKDLIPVLAEQQRLNKGMLEKGAGTWLAFLRNLPGMLRTLDKPGQVIENYRSSRRTIENGIKAPFEIEVTKRISRRTNEMWDRIQPLMDMDRGLYDKLYGGSMPVERLEELANMKGLLSTDRLALLQKEFGYRIDQGFFLHLMDHSGTEYNRAAVEAEFGWAPGTMLKLVDELTRKGIFTKEMWDDTQAQWDFNESTVLPALQKEYKKINHSPMTVEKASPFMAGDQEIKGGFFPIHFDPDFPVAQEFGGNPLENLTPEKASARRRLNPTAAAAMTLKRKGTGGRILSRRLDIMHDHVRASSAYAAYGEFAYRAMKVARYSGKKDEMTLSRAWRNAYGDADLKAFKDNVLAMVQDDAQDMNWLARRIETGANIAMQITSYLNIAMGLNAVQSLTPALQEMGLSIKDSRAYDAMGWHASNLVESYRTIAELSPTMALRLHALFGELTSTEAGAEVIHPVMAGFSKGKSIVGNFFLQMPDSQASVPMWYAALSKSLSDQTGTKVHWSDVASKKVEFSAEAMKKAVDYADRIILAVNPTMDRSATAKFTRGRGFMRMFNVYTVIRSAMGNRTIALAYHQRNKATFRRNIADIESRLPTLTGEAKMAAEARLAYNKELLERPTPANMANHFAMSVLLPAAMWAPIDAALRGDPKDEYADRMWKSLAKQFAGQATLGVFGAEQLAGAAVSTAIGEPTFKGKVPLAIMPYQMAENAALQIEKEVVNLAKGKPLDTRKDISAALEILALATGMPIHSIYKKAARNLGQE